MRRCPRRTVKDCCSVTSRPATTSTTLNSATSPKRSDAGRPPSTGFSTNMYLRGLHKAMFGEVWEWAGKYRQRVTNIGVAPAHVASDLRTLTQDAREWVEREYFEPDELAVRFPSPARHHPPILGRQRPAQPHQRRLPRSSTQAASFWLGCPPRSGYLCAPTRIPDRVAHRRPRRHLPTAQLRPKLSPSTTARQTAVPRRDYQVAKAGSQLRACSTARRQLRPTRGRLRISNGTVPPMADCSLPSRTGSAMHGTNLSIRRSSISLSGYPY